MKGMGDLLRQAQLMQSKMVTMQEELSQKTVEGSSGGGMVRVICTGKQEVHSIFIDKAVADPEDIGMLQDLVAAAVNDALRAAKKMAEKEMAAITGGIDLPGMPGL